MSSSFSSDRIARALAACEAATPGPWTWDTEQSGPTTYFDVENEDCRKITRMWVDGDPHGDSGVDASNNADFIALARTELPAALDALESARGALRRVAMKDCSLPHGWNRGGSGDCMSWLKDNPDAWCASCIARAELDKEQG